MLLELYPTYRVYACRRFVTRFANKLFWTRRNPVNSGGKNEMRETRFAETPFFYSLLFAYVMKLSVRSSKKVFF